MRDCSTQLNRAVVVTLLSIILATGAFGAPRTGEGDRERPNPIVKLLKRVIQALGDGLVIPTP